MKGRGKRRGKEGEHGGGGKENKKEGSGKRGDKEEGGAGRWRAGPLLLV